MCSRIHNGEAKNWNNNPHLICAEIQQLCGKDSIVLAVDKTGRPLNRYDKYVLHFYHPNIAITEAKQKRIYMNYKLNIIKLRLIKKIII